MVYRKHLCLVGLICISILGAVAFFNYSLDPAHLFAGNRYEARMVSILLTGKNIANVSNYDERLFQKHYIEKASTGKQVIILGSSRVMQISSANFPGQTFYNHSVSGATMEDDLSIFEMYLKEGHIPKTVVIGLDPWLLNKHHGQNRWRSLNDEYLAASRRLGLKTNTRLNQEPLFEFKKYKELISPSYLEASYQKWRRNAAIRDIYPTGEIYAEVPIKLTDGSMSYADSLREQSIEDVRKIALADANSSRMDSLDNFVELDPTYKNIFERHVSDLREKGIRVVLLLVPYHPAVYSVIVNDQRYRMVPQAQRYFEEFAKREGIKIIGSYNPADCMFGEKDFYDGKHPKKNAMDKMLRAIN